MDRFSAAKTCMCSTQMKSAEVGSNLLAVRKRSDAGLTLATEGRIPRPQLGDTAVCMHV